MCVCVCVCVCVCLSVSVSVYGTIHSHGHMIFTWTHDIHMHDCVPEGMLGMPI